MTTVEWIELTPEDAGLSELKAGMLVRDREGVVWLVGDCNMDGGQCNCCQGVYPGCVVAYSLSLMPVIDAARAAVEEVAR